MADELSALVREPDLEKAFTLDELRTLTGPTVECFVKVLGWGKVEKPERFAHDLTEAIASYGEMLLLNLSRRSALVREQEIEVTYRHTPEHEPDREAAALVRETPQQAKAYGDRCDDQNECNPYVASCGKHFCTMEEMNEHEHARHSLTTPPPSHDCEQHRQVQCGYPHHGDVTCSQCGRVSSPPPPSQQQERTK